MEFIKYRSGEVDSIDWSDIALDTKQKTRGRQGGSTGKASTSSRSVKGVQGFLVVVAE